MNTFDKWLETEEAKKLEITDIPKYTEELEVIQNKLKADNLDGTPISQKEKDVLDYLEYLENANSYKDKGDVTRALLNYKRAVWEKRYGKGTNI